MFLLLRRFWRRRAIKQLAVARVDWWRLGSWLLFIILAHTAAMVLFEQLSIADGLWLTLTTMTTVGYGDLSATTTAGRLSTVVLLYLMGIFLLGKLAGDYFDMRAEMRHKRLCGHWRWQMENHILIFNTPRESGERYFLSLIQHLRRSEAFCETAVQIVTTAYPDGLPQSLREMDKPALVPLLYSGDANDLETLRAVNVDKAKVVIILASDEHDYGSDSRTFDILHRLRDSGCLATVVAESVHEDDYNRERLRLAGADIVLRPIRAYPEMVVRGLVARGAEQVIENLFNSSLDEYVRYDLSFEAKWRDIVVALVDLGLAVAFEELTGAINCNPRSTELCRGEALIMIVNEGDKPPAQEVAALMQAHGFLRKEGE
ncbi:hypothetical protein D5085_05450 [Ectothiorhodospiraceae bacterium BW-2]|nr:hypothetical protein D5085_05450 [Ectothiorhodospiraceae bacterium BW-2]